jgi:hypothetical protein
MILNCFVSDDTFRRLQKVSIDTGRKVEELAEAAIEEVVGDYFRARKDDPVKVGASHDGR